jgi:hypothetical protein
MTNSLFFKNQAGKYHLNGTDTKQQIIDFARNAPLIFKGDGVCLKNLRK